MPVFAKINSFLSGDNIARAGYFPGFFSGNGNSDYDFQNGMLQGIKVRDANAE